MVRGESVMGRYSIFLLCVVSICLEAADYNAPDRSAGPEYESHLATVFGLLDSCRQSFDTLRKENESMYQTADCEIAPGSLYAQALERAEDASKLSCALYEQAKQENGWSSDTSFGDQEQTDDSSDETTSISELPKKDLLLSLFETIAAPLPEDEKTLLRAMVYRINDHQQLLVQQRRYMAQLKEEMQASLEIEQTNDHSIKRSFKSLHTRLEKLESDIALLLSIFPHACSRTCVTGLADIGSVIAKQSQLESKISDLIRKTDYLEDQICHLFALNRQQASEIQRMNVLSSQYSVKRCSSTSDILSVPEDVKKQILGANRGCSSRPKDSPEDNDLALYVPTQFLEQSMAIEQPEVHPIHWYHQHTEGAECTECLKQLSLLVQSSTSSGKEKKLSYTRPTGAVSDELDASSEKSSEEASNTAI